jgi:hypothetical protein
MASVTNVVVQDILCTPGFCAGVAIHCSKAGCS